MALIMLVEDAPDTQRVVSFFLKRMGGHTVLLANHGQEAIDLLPKERPDLILMDLNMPVLDGWEATARIKAMPDYATIPILAITAHGYGTESARAMAAGCSGIITKPVDFDEMLRVIDSYVNPR